MISSNVGVYVGYVMDGGHVEIVSLDAISCKSSCLELGKLGPGKGFCIGSTK